MGTRDVAEQLEAAIEEVGKLEREVATLRAEKDSPHADAKYWRAWRAAAASEAKLSLDVAELEREIRAMTLTRLGTRLFVEGERDAALAVIEAIQVVVDEERIPDQKYGDDWILAENLTAALAKSPADALAEHDRQVKAEALEEAAKMRRGADSLGVENVPADWLLDRAAEYRKAT